MSEIMLTAEMDATEVSARFAIAELETITDRRLGDLLEGAFDVQRLGARVALTRRIAVLAGGPGTGKSHTVARLLAAFHQLARDDQPARVGARAVLGDVVGPAIDSRRARRGVGRQHRGHPTGPPLRRWFSHRHDRTIWCQDLAPIHRPLTAPEPAERFCGEALDAHRLTNPDKHRAQLHGHTPSVLSFDAWKSPTSQFMKSEHRDGATP